MSGAAIEMLSATESNKTSPCCFRSSGKSAIRCLIATPGLEVTVVATRAGTDLRYERMTVTTAAAMDGNALDALVRRAIRFCWVSNTLTAGLEVEYRSTSMDVRFRK